MKKKELILKHLKILFFSFYILITTVLFGLRITVLNKSFVKSEFTTSHYEKVENNIKTEMKNSMISTGIDNSVIDTIFTKDDVKKSTEQVLSIIYDNNKQEFDTSNIQTRLEENVKENLEKHNYVLQDVNGYNHFIESTIKIYRNEFIMLNQLPKIGSYMQKAIKLTTVMIITLAMILFILIVARFKTMKHILPPCLFATSFVTLFGCFYINKEAGLESITIFSVTFSEVLRKIISNTFHLFQNLSYAYIIIGFLIIIFFIRKKYKHHHHHHHHES